MRTRRSPGNDDRRRGPNRRLSAPSGPRSPRRRSSERPGRPTPPRPTIDPSEHMGPARSENPLPASMRLEYGPWDKGRAWANAAALLGLTGMLFFVLLMFNVVGKAFLLLGIGFGLAMLMTIRVGLALDPQDRGTYHPEDYMSDRRWLKMQRSLLRRIAMKLTLGTSHVADWILTFVWRRIRRLTGTRFG